MIEFIGAHQMAIRFRIFVALTASMVIASPIQAQSGQTSTRCVVTRKVDNETVYSDEELAKWKPSVRIIATAKATVLQRCGFSLVQGRMTCDSYDVDRVEEDRYVHIKKYYVFASQFDVQVFPSGLFIENNGRGTIAFGQCAPGD